MCATTSGALSYRDAAIVGRTFSKDWEYTQQQTAELDGGGVVGHDRLATTFLRWLASPAGPDFRGRYFQGESKSLLFGTSSRPAYALIFPPLSAPGAAAEIPTAIDFRVSGPFSAASATSRKAAHNAETSS